MHQSSYNIITRFRELVEKTFPQEKIKILDIGSYGVNGTYKEIFSESEKYLYTGLDVNPGPNVDYVPSDPYIWPELQDESFDVIISGQAFEHIEYPWLIVEEMNRVLKKNGLICIVAPSRGPEHKYPVDCWRYYPDGFRSLAKWVHLEVLEAKTSWGKSGFTDGSDQWGDTFCIFYKPINQDKMIHHTRKVKSTSRSFNRNNPLRQNKQNSYYGFARPEVVEAIIKNKLPTGKVLEIGCAGGATGKKLKERLPVQSYVGVEISPKAADIAKNHLDRVIVANIEKTDLASEHGIKLEEFDLLLALDVLEHLYDPWDILAELSCYVKPGGYVVASLPNIQNITIVQDLIKGNWQYQDAGILDATHLRFFTLEASEKMFSGAGLAIKSIEHVINPSIDIDKVKELGNKYCQENLEIANLTKKELLDLFTYQYILIAQKVSSIDTAHDASVKNAASEENLLLPHFKQDHIVPALSSIVILTFNGLEYTKRCVKSIRKHTPEPHEIIFVDNGSTDGTVKWLKTLEQENKNYKLIENKQNLGFAKGCNQGIEAARGEFILLLNNDVVVAEGWLSGMLDCLKNAPDAGIVGPMTNNISGPQQIHDDSYRSVDYLDKYAALFREKHRHRRILFRRIVGFCMLFKRALAEQIGLLDERFSTGNFEDDDFCLRADLAGYISYIAGDVFIHHYGSRSFIGNKIDYSAAMSSNRKIIKKKWTLSTSTPEGKKMVVIRALDLAYDFYQRGKIDQSVEALINCIKLTPDAKEIYYALVRMFIETKRFSEAQEVIDTMPDMAKKELKGLECAGYTKEGLGLDDEADAYADKMLALNDMHAVALNLKGVLAYKKGEKEKAQYYFKKAMDADPGYGEAHTNLGVMFWSMDKKDDAFAHLRKGFSLSPIVPDVSSLYYSVASSLERLNEAETDFWEASKLYLNNRNVLFLYIDSLLQQEKYSFAMTEIENALDTFGLDEGTLKAALAVREKIGPLQIDKSSKKSSLSLCMIVKNEERYLVKCLKSVRDIVDEMIIVDTGSTDKTKDIAIVFGAKIFDFPWTGDFAEARNHSLEPAVGDWILVLDADEVISQRDFDELRKLICKGAPMPAAYSILTRNYVDNVNIIGWTANKGEYPEELGGGWIPSYKVRLLTKRKNIYFSSPVHESLEDSIVKENIPIKPCKIIVHHYGKLSKPADTKKGETYYLLGRIKLEEDPNNCQHIQELSRQALALGRYEESAELSLKLLELAKTDPKAKAYMSANNPMKMNSETEAYMHLTSSYLTLERFKDALSASQKAIQLGPNIREVVLNYANCEIIAGSVEKAYTALQDLLHKEPDYPPALLMLSVVFCLTNKVEMMQNLFKTLVNRKYNIIPAMNTTARLFYIQKKNEEARLILHAMTENRLFDKETTDLLNILQNSKSRVDNAS